MRKIRVSRLFPTLLRIRRAFAMVLRGDFRTLAARLREYLPRDYRKWIRRYDSLDDQKRGQIVESIRAMPRRPLISVLMPVFNPPAEVLRQAIDSVRNQLYPDWELCIADDASTLPHIRPLLENFAARDSRIKVVFRKTNGHISAASNSALELAGGEFAALLDHDDLLPEHALYHVAAAINRHPDAGVIYSDEDKVDLANNRVDPYFKSDWNYDLFLSHNMISHFGVYRTGLVMEVGGFRSGFEGSQDYDLALRCIEKLDSSQIVHIPRILYHWRMIPGSAAVSSDEKPYALLAGERALNEHLSRTGARATAAIEENHYRVRHALPDQPPLVSIIILTRNGFSLLSRCLASIREHTTYPRYEIIVVDNGSDDRATLDYLEEIGNDPGVRIMRDPSSFNFSRLNNAAVARAGGEIVVLLNNDIEVISPDWLTELVSHAMRPGVGAVGARLWYPDGTLQHCGVILGIGGVAGHGHLRLNHKGGGYFGWARIIRSCSAVTAACLAIRTSIYREVGGLNEEELAVAFNDVDFCIRVREAGYRNVWTPYAELMHHESATRGRDDSPEKQARFNREVAYMQRRWGHLLDRDPAYSPDLTLNRTDFSLAWPPRLENADHSL